jgi:MATE family, multidrug efflux pump
MRQERIEPVLLVPLGVEPAVAREAGHYLLWRLPGLPSFLAFFGARAYLQGLGAARPMVWATAVANLANIPADVLLVFGGAALPAWAWPLQAVPAMGAAGAAMATSLVCALQLGVLARAIAAVPLPPGDVPRRPDPPALRAALRVGLPVGLHMGAEVGIFALVGVSARACCAARARRASPSSRTSPATGGSASPPRSCSASRPAAA